MAKRGKRETGSAEALPFKTFAQYITRDKKEEVHALGSREVLDLLMEGIATKQIPREPIAPHRLYLSYIPCQMMFEMAPLSTDFGMCVVWFLEEVGFTPEEIQDALAWYYGGQGAPIEEVVDIAILRRMQEMC